MTLDGDPLRVALTMRVTSALSYREPRDSISHDWIVRLGEWGMVPLLIPNNLKKPTDYVDSLNPDIIIFTGGDEPGDSAARDNTETELLRHTLEKGIPALGVCRGMQVINAFFGGHCDRVEGHVASVHNINFGTEWLSIFGNNAQVNSYHQWGITRNGLGEGLSVAGEDDDGLVEALFIKGEPVAGLMWHPERRVGANGDEALIRNLVK